MSVTSKALVPLLPRLRPQHRLALGSYVRARRLSEAAKTLVAGPPDILTVALDAGYGSQEAFTGAFRQHFGLTPDELREWADLGGLDLREPIRMEDNTVTPAFERYDERFDARTGLGGFEIWVPIKP